MCANSRPFATYLVAPGSNSSTSVKFKGVHSEIFVVFPLKIDLFGVFPGIYLFWYSLEMWDKLLSVLLLAPDLAPSGVEKTLSFLPDPVSFVVAYAQLPSEFTSVCVQLSDEKLSFAFDGLPSTDCIAYGSFQETIFETGWNQLTVRFDQSVIGAYAAGLVEGLLTVEQTEAHVGNMRKVYGYGNLEALYRYYGEVDEVVVELVGRMGGKEDGEFWDAILSTRLQLEGILDGLHLLGLPLTMEDLYFINTDGDIDNLFMLTSDPFTRLGYSFLSNLSRPDRCSALVKLTPTDLLMGHTTMEDYGEMNRVLKTYETGGVTVRMSSYPGAVSSTDDFMVSSLGLAVMETSLPLEGGVLKGGKTGLPAFYRIQAGMRLAGSPADFISAMENHDSFTYSSQWMIVDYKRVAERPLQSAFFVFETAPKYSQFGDFSAYLEENGYWASYNWPYFPETYLAIGLATVTEPQDLRKAQFATLQGEASSIEGMMAVMQYNDWAGDGCEKDGPLQPCNPENAISPRFDLGKEKTMFGGTDSKVTSSDLMSTPSFFAISGPTHQSLPPYSFPSPNPFSYIPTTWSFDWLLYPSSIPS